MKKMSINDEEAMRLALQEGAKGWGWVAPNPPVGAVIRDRDGNFVSSGFHGRFGGPHAEIDALNKVTDPSQLKGATLFVTLEPCAHQGKTPPCAEALARLPLKKVVYGVMDPNPKVSGRGLEIIKAAGIEVAEMTSLKNECLELAEVFHHIQKNKSPFFALKIASSLDGQVALKSGESRWLTGECARQVAHELRARYDAVLVGVNTVLQDDPELNVRHCRFPEKRNRVVVLDPAGAGLKKMKTLKLFRSHEPSEILWLVSSKVHLTQEGAEGLAMDQNGDFDWNELESTLMKHKISSALVEGGGDTVGRFLWQKRAQRFHLFFAPKFIGQSFGRPWSLGRELDCLTEAPRLERVRSSQLETDLLIEGILPSHFLYQGPGLGAGSSFS